MAAYPLFVPPLDQSTVMGTDHSALLYVPGFAPGRDQPTQPQSYVRPVWRPVSTTHPHLFRFFIRTGLVRPSRLEPGRLRQPLCGTFDMCVRMCVRRTDHVYALPAACTLGARPASQEASSHRLRRHRFPPAWGFPHAKHTLVHATPHGHMPSRSSSRNGRHTCRPSVRSTFVGTAARNFQ